jgi:hypothetical protein
MRVLCCLALLGACRWPPIDREPDVTVKLTIPEISSLSLTCDTEKERWQLDVTATSWTGGGGFWWSTDGVYIEAHDVLSRKAAEDGSFDELRLRLDIVADWRWAEANQSTPFLCASGPVGRFVLFDLEGKVVDCEDVGVANWLDSVDFIPSCAP